MDTQTVALPGGTVELNSPVLTRTMGDEERRMLEAARGGLIGQISAYMDMANRAHTTDDRVFWLELRRGDLVKLAAVEGRMGIKRRLDMKFRDIGHAAAELNKAADRGVFSMREYEEMISAMLDVLQRHANLIPAESVDGGHAWHVLSNYDSKHTRAVVCITCHHGAIQVRDRGIYTALSVTCNGR